MIDIAAAVLPWSFHIAMAACFALGAWPRARLGRAAAAALLIAYAFGIHMSASYYAHGRPARVWEDFLDGREGAVFGVLVWGIPMAFFPFIPLLLAAVLGFLARIAIHRLRDPAAAEPPPPA